MPSSPNSLVIWSALPAELRLLLLCCRWPPGGDKEDEEDEGNARIRALLAEPESSSFDWEYFLTLCGHHRLAPMACRALGRIAEASRVPAPILAELKAAATRNAHSTLQYLAETQRLCELLQQAGVSVRVLKGVPLSQQIYADPALRHVGDIDLLIAPGEEETADHILIADGYLRNDPAAPLTPRRRLSWRRHGKDYTYSAEHSGFEVDLHWRLFRNPHMPGNGLADVPGSAASEQIVLGEVAWKVLPAERCFLFLCVHGALDGWLRFKSLVDVAAWWRSFVEGQRQRVTEIAREHGVLPELAAALRLATDLQLVDSDAVAPALQLQADRREARWILHYSMTQHAAQRFQPTQERVGSFLLKQYEFGLRRGLAYRWEILGRVLLRPRVWAQFDLPDALFPLYALLSPLEWVLFHRRLAADAAGGRRQPPRWRRLLGLPVQRQALLAEALCWLAAARAALLVLPTRWIFRWMERPLTGNAHDEDAAEGVRWAVISAARYGPFSFVCFPQALAAHAMLRRRGVASVMHYGVRRSADRQMRGHTWLEVNGSMLLGGESAPLFTRMRSSKPGESER